MDLSLLKDSPVRTTQLLAAGQSILSGCGTTLPASSPSLSVRRMRVKWWISWRVLRAGQGWSWPSGEPLALPAAAKPHCTAVPGTQLAQQGSAELQNNRKVELLSCQQCWQSEVMLLPWGERRRLGQKEIVCLRQCRGYDVLVVSDNWQVLSCTFDYADVRKAAINIITGHGVVGDCRADLVSPFHVRGTH